VAFGAAVALLKAWPSLLKVVNVALLKGWPLLRGLAYSVSASGVISIVLLSNCFKMSFT
jgi:hypothetical protein